MHLPSAVGLSAVIGHSPDAVVSTMAVFVATTLYGSLSARQPGMTAAFRCFLTERATPSGGRGMATNMTDEASKQAAEASASIGQASEQAKDVAQRAAKTAQDAAQTASETGQAAWDVAQKASAKTREVAGEAYAHGERTARELGRRGVEQPPAAPLVPRAGGSAIAYPLHGPRRSPVPPAGGLIPNPTPHPREKRGPLAAT